jgi:hypothetical protein
MKGYLIAVAVHVADLATSFRYTCPTIRFASQEEASQEEVPKSRKLDYSKYNLFGVLTTVRY